MNDNHFAKNGKYNYGGRKLPHERSQRTVEAREARDEYLTKAFAEGKTNRRMRRAFGKAAATLAKKVEE